MNILEKTREEEKTNNIKRNNVMCYLEEIGYEKTEEKWNNTYKIKNSIYSANVIFYEKENKVIAESNIKQKDIEILSSKSITEKELITKEVLIKMLQQVLPNSLE